MTAIVKEARVASMMSGVLVLLVLMFLYDLHLCNECSDLVGFVHNII